MTLGKDSSDPVTFGQHQQLLRRLPLSPPGGGRPATFKKKQIKKTTKTTTTTTTKTTTKTKKTTKANKTQLQYNKITSFKSNFATH